MDKVINQMVLVGILSRKFLRRIFSDNARRLTILFSKSRNYFQTSKKIYQSARIYPYTIFPNNNFQKDWAILLSIYLQWKFYDKF